MADSIKLQDTTYKLIMRGLEGEEIDTKVIQLALVYLKQFPPQETLPQADEMSEMLSMYDRNRRAQKKQTQESVN